MAGNIEDCLKKFIIHVDALGKEDEPGGDGFWREFRDLRELQQTHKSENKFPADQGKKDCNVKKNRYKDILPYDYHRVKLKEINGIEGSDYINASFIEDINGHRSYIASQGPLPHTVNDFWRMLWEYEVEIVFMVCREEEQGRNKCQRYWTEEGETKSFGDIDVTLESEEEIFPDFVERKLCAKCNNRTHCLRQFHYTGWPDHGVPKHSQEIYKMVGKMREERRKLQIPIVIHCSAGCGRTGTICAVDYAWTMLDQGKIAHGFSMYEIIRKIREQRQSMVQTPDQYEFVHLVVQSLCEDWLNKFQEHDYANTEFHAPSEEEEVYYNTFGINASSSIKEDVQQQTKDVAPLSPSPRSDGPKRPQPTPRPAGLAAEVNNNNKKSPGSPQETSLNYENVIPASRKSSNSVSSGSKASVSNGTTNVPQKNVTQKGPAPTKPAHSTVIAINPKAPPSHHPPLLPQGQADAHKHAVINMSQPAVRAGQAAQGTVQKTANARKASSSDNQSAANVQQELEYGVVMKDSHSGKLNTYPVTSQSQVDVGQKRRDSTGWKSRHKGDIQQNYENFQPLMSQQSYENFIPLCLKEIATAQTASSPQESVPVLPSRNYGPEAYDNQVSKQPDTVSKHPPGTVSAIGGGPPSQQGGVHLHDVNSGPVPMQRKERTYDSPSVSTPSSHGGMGQSSGRGAGVLMNTLGRLVQGRGRQQAHVQQNVSTRPGETMYRDNNIGFPNRVAKPAGRRQPGRQQFTTRL